MKKKINYTESVTINKDVWFYPAKKTLQFVVWNDVGDGKKVVKLFTIRHSKLKKYL